MGLMSLYPQGTFSGEYKASPPQDLVRAELVIGHEFGAPEDTAEGPGVVNEAIAKLVVSEFSHLPVFAPESVASAIDKYYPGLDVTLLENTTSNKRGTEGGTYEELVQVRARLKGKDMPSVHIGQAFHIGRILEQAKFVGFDPMAPADLPSFFDPASIQPWCQNRSAWRRRELFGVPVLKVTGRL